LADLGTRGGIIAALPDFEVHVQHAARFFCLFPLVLLLAFSCPAQDAGAKSRPALTAQRNRPFGQRRNDDEDLVRLEKEQAKRRNKARFESLKRDTDKLLELATELKQDVDRSDENVLSLDVIKKAEEIEKLAKQVKGKMKQ
jgi:hypothetical protein